eukprot:Tbor_TRINITY_DN4888_c0_g1::TRINITY_DN4888_c0_g1_i1::g.1260::m.1260
MYPSSTLSKMDHPINDMHILKTHLDSSNGGGDFKAEFAEYGCLSSRKSYKANQEDRGGTVEMFVSWKLHHGNHSLAVQTPSWFGTRDHMNGSRYVPSDSFGGHLAHFSSNFGTANDKLNSGATCQTSAASLMTQQTAALCATDCLSTNMPYNDISPIESADKSHSKCEQDVKSPISDKILGSQWTGEEELERVPIDEKQMVLLGESHQDVKEPRPKCLVGFKVLSQPAGDALHTSDHLLPIIDPLAIDTYGIFDPHKYMEGSLFKAIVARVKSYNSQDMNDFKPLGSSDYCSMHDSVDGITF